MPDEDKKTSSEESRSGRERRRRRRSRSNDNRSQGRPHGNSAQAEAKRAARPEDNRQDNRRDNRPSARPRNLAQAETKRAPKPDDNRVVGRTRGNPSPGEAKKAAKPGDNRSSTPSSARSQDNRQDNRSSGRSRNSPQGETRRGSKPNDNRSAARPQDNAQHAEARRAGRPQTGRETNRGQIRPRASGQTYAPPRPTTPEPKIEDWREPETQPRSTLQTDGQQPINPDDPFEEAREPAGAIFFRSFENYDQKQALGCLTDLNIKLLEEAKPAAGEWTYLALVEERCSDKEIEHIKRSFPVPPGVYAVLVDSGLSLRAIMTASPMYERMLEFNFIAEASFDCWIQGEWMREEVFEGKEELLKRASQLLKQYLEKDIDSHQEIAQAPHIAGAVPPARTEW